MTLSNYLSNGLSQPENSDELRLVLALPETDQFYDKKKKLLEDLGFDTEVYVSIKSSSGPEQLNDSLNVLLQGARIINLNEVELYFSEDIIDMVDCYSPRNELEALHSILKVIDDSLSSNTIENVQQNLRDLTVDRMHKVGNKFGEETIIVGDSNPDKESCLLNWGIHNGVKTKLDIAYIEGAGRGAIAREDLKVGDIALDIPVSLIISEELLYETDMFTILENIDGISEETMLLLWSMREKHNAASKFKLYFDTLPEKFNTGLSFGINAIMALEGTLLLEEIVQAKEHIRAQYEMFPALSEHHPHVFPPELYTWEQFLWACELWYSNSMKIIFGDGKLRTCLIPIGGFLNHSICPHITHYGRIDAATNSIKFPLSRPCNTGEQCFLSYGTFSSSHLLTFYGFLSKGNNPYDVIPLDIDVSGDEDPEDGVPAPEWCSHMVRGTWLSKSHNIFHYGLPSPLLDHLRRSRSSLWQPDTNSREFLETDVDVLRDLNSTFEGMMDALSDENSSREATWDVKLAVEFKAMQQRIVSSILTSCNAGIELLESELRKHNTL